MTDEWSKQKGGSDESARLDREEFARRLARDMAGLTADEARRFAREMAGLSRRLAQEFRDREREERHRSREERREERHREREEPRRASGFGPPPPGGWKEGDPARGPRTEHALSLEGVASVSIDQTAGRLTVRLVGESETPGVTSIGRNSPPRVEVRRDGDRISIEVKMQTGWLFKGRHGATTVVRLVPGVSALKLNLGYGDAQVRDLACDTIDLDVGAGTISTFSTRSRLRANVGAGKISIHDHSGLANCDTGTGDLLMDIAEVVPGDYRANTGIGRAELRLPAGAAVNIRASSGIGRTRVEFPGAGEDAPSRVRVETGIGEVSVRVREPGAQPVVPPPPAGPRPGRAGAGTARRREAEELRVLQLLEQGRITSQEAADLIAALQGAAPPVDEDTEPPSGGPEIPPTEAPPGA